jgi:hypothetical protein
MQSVNHDGVSVVNRGNALWNRVNLPGFVYCQRITPSSLVDMQGRIICFDKPCWVATWRPAQVKNIFAEQLTCTA